MRSRPTPTLAGLPLELAWKVAEYLPAHASFNWSLASRSLSAAIPLRYLYAHRYAKHVVAQCFQATPDAHLVWEKCGRDAVMRVPPKLMLRSRLLEDALVAAVAHGDEKTVEHLVSLGLPVVQREGALPHLCVPLRGASKSIGRVLATLLLPTHQPIPPTTPKILANLTRRAPGEVIMALAQHPAFRASAHLHCAMHTLRHALRFAKYKTSEPTVRAHPPYTRHAHVALDVVMGAGATRIAAQLRARDVRHASTGAAAFAAALAVAAAAVFDDAEALAALEVGGGVRVPVAAEDTQADFMDGDFNDSDDDEMDVDSGLGITLPTPLALPTPLTQAASDAAHPWCKVRAARHLIGSVALGVVNALAPPAPMRRNSGRQHQQPAAAWGIGAGQQRSATAPVGARVAAALLESGAFAS